MLVTLSIGSVGSRDLGLWLGSNRDIDVINRPGCVSTNCLARYIHNSLTEDVNS